MDPLFPQQPPSGGLEPNEKSYILEGGALPSTFNPKVRFEVFITI